METIPFGQTSLRVSRLAVGCWQLNPSFWGQTDLALWEQAMDAAVEAGVNFVDTADAYGDGLAEDLLGQYWEKTGSRDRWILATKFYWDFTSPIPESISMNRVPNAGRDYILQACERSLQRLRTDRIDLYQMHAWTPLARPEEIAEAITRLKQQGKILHFGVSNWNVDQMEMLQRWLPVESLQPKYNPLNRLAEAREFPYCLRQQMGTLIYSPLERGLFGGHIRAGQPLGDHRDRDPLFSAEGSAKLSPVLEQLRGWAHELGLTLPQLIIRWVLTHPAVQVAIIGTKRPEHITTLLSAGAEPLPAAYWHAIAQAMPKELAKL